MSSERGNAVRSRPQKYQNRTAYKKDRYGTTPETKALDALKIVGLCDRCNNVIAWKIKFKKYKKLTVPGKCTKCLQKTIREAYHTICRPCASASGKCPKCCEDMSSFSQTSTLDKEGTTDLITKSFVASENNEDLACSGSELHRNEVPVERKTENCLRDIKTDSTVFKRNRSPIHSSSPDLSTDTDESGSESD